MTKSEVNYVLDSLGINPNITLDCENVIRYISLQQAKTIFPRRDSNRICFDNSDEIIKVYHCEKTNLSQPEPGWIEKKDYDEIDGVIYKYLMDVETNMPIFDFYDYNAIAVIA